MRVFALCFLITLLCGCGSTKRLVESHTTDRVFESTDIKESSSVVFVSKGSTAIINDEFNVERVIVFFPPDSAGNQGISSVTVREKSRQTNTDILRSDSSAIENSQQSNGISYRDFVRDETIVEQKSENRQIFYLALFLFGLSLVILLVYRRF